MGSGGYIFGIECVCVMERSGILQMMKPLGSVMVEGSFREMFFGEAVVVIWAEVRCLLDFEWRILVLDVEERGENSSWIKNMIVDICNRRR